MNSFKHIRVNQVFKNADKEYVEVLDEDRPKPAVDSKYVFCMINHLYM